MRLVRMFDNFIDNVNIYLFKCRQQYIQLYCRCLWQQTNDSKNKKSPRGKVRRCRSLPTRACPLGENAYFAAISATVVSSMRFEKPHSLSYHDDTLTRRPDTLVRVESKFDEAGLWLKSIDTSGSVW